MRDLSQIAFEDDNASDDEIDELFSHLEQFEPPADFVERVMTLVSRLPFAQEAQPAQADDDESLVVGHRPVSPIQ